MRIIFILLLILMHMSSCVTVVFEPYMGDEHEDNRSDQHREVNQSSLDEY